MKKYIYYVDLNTINTNEQLTAVFQYVNNSTTGGIVVFEDIDVMSNIVLSRPHQTSFFKQF
jgi:hypothetical protein